MGWALSRFCILSSVCPTTWLENKMILICYNLDIQTFEFYTIFIYSKTLFLQFWQLFHNVKEHCREINRPDLTQRSKFTNFRWIFYLYFTCLSIFLVCTYMYHICTQCLWKPKEGTRPTVSRHVCWLQE